MRYGLVVILAAAAAGGCRSGPPLEATRRDARLESAVKESALVGKGRAMVGEKVVKTEEEWKKELSPEQYHILREKGTERPFTGKYNDHSEAGMYACAGCGQELFKSETKFGSHCGWPSFWDSIDKSRISYHADYSHGMDRVEVTCSRCGGHLGHIFDDGPPPTGKRFCINSESLRFIPAGKDEDAG